jgi:hypothetical protein
MTRLPLGKHDRIAAWLFSMSHPGEHLGQVPGSGMSLEGEPVKAFDV